MSTVRANYTDLQLMKDGDRKRGSTRPHVLYQKNPFLERQFRHKPARIHLNYLLWKIRERERESEFGFDKII